MIEFLTLSVNSRARPFEKEQLMGISKTKDL